jgi:hypothetical protein
MAVAYGVTTEWCPNPLREAFNTKSVYSVAEPQPKRSSP